MSGIDELTGALKRDAFLPFLRNEIERASVANKPLFLMCANIDNLKRFNGHNGHAAGDGILSTFVELASAEFDGRFPIFRYGGDWFAAVLTGITIEEARRLALGVCAEAKNRLAPVQLEHCGDRHCEGPAKVSVSVGIAVWVEGKTVEGLVQEAEELLNGARASGRGKVGMSTALDIKPENMLTARPKSILSIGKTSDLVIPADLEYAGALKALLHSARGLYIKIDLATFYSEAPIELHDFVDTITYRFMEENGVVFLAYEVSTHYGGVYCEVRYGGEEIRSWTIGVPIAADREELLKRAERERFTLGIGSGA